MLVLNYQLESNLFLLQRTQYGFIQPVRFPDPSFEQIPLYRFSKQPFRHGNCHKECMWFVRILLKYNSDRIGIDSLTRFKQCRDGLPAGKPLVFR